MPSKAGKLPTARFSNGTIVCHPDHQLEIQSQSDKFMQNLPSNTLAFNLHLSNLTARKLELISRALLKLALEGAYIEKGYWHVVDPRWNAVRAAVLAGGHTGYIVMPHDFRAGEGPLEFSCKASEDGSKVAVHLAAHGVAIGAVLGHELPTSVMPGVAQVLSFPEPARCSPLGMRLEMTYGGRKVVPWADPSMPAAMREAQEKLKRLATATHGDDAPGS